MMQALRPIYGAVACALRYSMCSVKHWLTQPKACLRHEWYGQQPWASAVAWGRLINKKLPFLALPMSSRPKSSSQSETLLLQGFLPNSIGENATESLITSSGYAPINQVIWSTDMPSIRSRYSQREQAVDNRMLELYIWSSVAGILLWNFQIIIDSCKWL